MEVTLEDQIGHTSAHSWMKDSLLPVRWLGAHSFMSLRRERPSICSSASRARRAARCLRENRHPLDEIGWLDQRQASAFQALGVSWKLLKDISIDRSIALFLSRETYKQMDG